MTKNSNITSKIIWRAIPVCLTFIATFMGIRYVIINMLHIPSDAANRFVAIILVISLVPATYGFYLAIMRDYYNKEVHGEFWSNAISSSRVAKSIVLLFALILIPIFYIAINYILFMFYGLLFIGMLGKDSMSFVRLAINIISLTGATAVYYFLYKNYTRNVQT